MKKLRFFKCKHCGNVVIKLIDKSVPIFCCGEIMEELFANTIDASTEKHLPVVIGEGDLLTVKVGEIAHPMEETHYINFVAVETEKGYIVETLSPNSAPEAKIYVGEAKVIAVYEYCNLHGLWKTEL